MEIFKKIDALVVENIGLKELGFSHLDYKKDYNIGFFYRESKDKIDILSYGYGYDYRDHDPIRMAKEGFRAWISFKNVETILDFVIYNKNDRKQSHNTDEFYLNNQHTIYNGEAPNIAKDTFFYVVFRDDKLLLNNILEASKETETFIKK